MIALPAFKDRSVMVLGLARSGIATVKALAASGAHVLAWDDAQGARDRAAEAGVKLQNPATANAADWAVLVMSPGIPLTHPPHPIAVMARSSNVPVICDIELLSRANTGAALIGITGTNGKSTTTTLIGHILKSASRSVETGGNLGFPVLDLPQLDTNGTYVIEISSYQLDLIEQTQFDIAVLLNITPDHLDRHGDMNGYIAAKERIFQKQATTGIAIIGIDDPSSAAIAHRLRDTGRKVIAISVVGPLQRGVWVSDGRLVDDCQGHARDIIDLRQIATLPGAHNWQNAAAAYVVCREAGLSTDTIVAGLKTYPGLVHRQETIGVRGRVRFVNDSKATNADAAAKALGCYERIFWIAGGVAKAGGIESLRPYFNRLAHAYLIGAAAENFAATIGDAAPITLSGDLTTAVRQAAVDSADDLGEAPIVLLSPACASFDQFPNFEVRGDTFRSAVTSILAKVQA